MGHTGANQYTKWPDWKISDETRAKISTTSLGRKVSDATKAKLAKATLGRDYSGSPRGRTKLYVVSGKVVQGTWELFVASLFDQTGVHWERCSESFEYHFSSRYWRYTPDFVLPNVGCFVEVKGYATERDYAKWRDFPKALLVLQRAEMQIIVSMLHAFSSTDPKVLEAFKDLSR
jgi:hypothetical protein